MLPHFKCELESKKMFKSVIDEKQAHTQQSLSLSLKYKHIFYVFVFILVVAEKGFQTSLVELYIMKFHAMLSKVISKKIIHMMQ